MRAIVHSSIITITTITTITIITTKTARRHNYIKNFSLAESMRILLFVMILFSSSHAFVIIRRRGH
eukprot:5647938-Ditylum_brightwellii.AAC.1